jgi:Rieske Fe-S protein
MSVTRRTVLQTAAVAGVGVATAGALAACSTDSGSGGGGDGGDSTGAAGDSVATADVPVGSGVIVGDTVFTQPVAGEFAAFSTTCPHNQCPVDAVKADVISCPCHGSQFSIEDGSVLRGPARQGLAAQTVTIEGDQVVAS